MKKLASVIMNHLASAFKPTPRPARQTPEQMRVVTHFEKRVARLIHQETRFTSHLTTSKTNQVYFKIKNERGLLIGVALIKPETSEALIPKNYIREAVAMRDKYNLPLAYVATLGYFSKEATMLARKLNVRLITRDNFRDGVELKVAYNPIKVEETRGETYGHERFMPPHLRKAGKTGQRNFIEADIPVLDGRDVPLHEIPLNEQRLIRVLPERTYENN